MKNILIIGEALIDQYSTKDNITNEVGGASFNVACCISKLGENAIFAGAIGKDKEAEEIIKLANEFKVNLDLLQKVNEKTTKAIVSLNEFNDRNFDFLRGADIQYVFNENEFKSINLDFIHFGSATAFLGGNLKQSYYDCYEFSLKNKIPFSFDPNFRDKLWKDTIDIESFIKECEKFICNSTIIKVSEEELNLLSYGENIEAKLTNLSLKNQKALICVTMGEKGTLVYYNQKVIKVKTLKSEKVLDTTGAGDAFISSLIKLYSNLTNFSYSNIEEIVKKSNLFAKNAVEKVGALSFLRFLK